MSLSVVCLLILFGIGIAALFWGKKFVAVLIGLGFFTVAQNALAGTTLDAEWILFVEVGAALLGFFMAKSAEKLAFFLIGAIVGWTIGLYLINTIPGGLDETTVLLTEVIFALIFGFLSAAKTNTFIELFTSFYGGVLLSEAIVFVFFHYQTISSANNSGNLLRSLEEAAGMISTNASEHALIVLVLAVVLTIAGFRYQKHH